MGLEELIAQMYNTNTNLPLGYGQMWNNTFKPAYDFQNQMGSNNANFQSSQGNNRAGIAQSGIGATGNIGSSAIGGYGGIAGLDAQAQQFNSLSPVLSGLMNQYAPAGSQALPGIRPMQQNYLGGYGNMVNQGYQNVNSQVQNGYGQMDQNQSQYGDAQDKTRQDFGDAFGKQMDKMPRNPWERQPVDEGAGGGGGGSGGGDNWGFGDDMRYQPVQQGQNPNNPNEAPSNGAVLYGQGAPTPKKAQPAQDAWAPGTGNGNNVYRF